LIAPRHDLWGVEIATLHLLKPINKGHLQLGLGKLVQEQQSNAPFFSLLSLDVFVNLLEKVL